MMAAIFESANEFLRAHFLQGRRETFARLILSFLGRPGLGALANELRFCMRKAQSRTVLTGRTRRRAISVYDSPSPRQRLICCLSTSDISVRLNVELRADISTTRESACLPACLLACPVINEGR